MNFIDIKNAPTDTFIYFNYRDYNHQPGCTYSSGHCVHSFFNDLDRDLGHQRGPLIWKQETHRRNSTAVSNGQEINFDSNFNKLATGGRMMNWRAENTLKIMLYR